MSNASGLSGLSRPGSETSIPAPARRWGTRVFLPVSLLVLLLLVVGYAARDAFTPRVPVEVVPVVVKRGGATTGAVLTQAAGWVEPDPLPIYVGALADGVIEEIYVLDGADVEAGQVVARLIDDDARLAYDRAVAHTGEARAAVETARADLEAAERDWAEPVERDRAVAAAEADADRLRAAATAAVAQVRVHDAEIERLDDELTRRRIEVESGASSEFMVTQTELEIAVVREQRTMAEAAAEAAQAAARRAEADLTAAREQRRLRIPETRALAVAKAELARREAALVDAEGAEGEAELRLSRMEVRSPVGGRVQQLLSSPGDKLMLGMDGKHSAHVLHLYHPDRLQVRVDVPLADAALVGVGQAARITVEVLPDRTFDGEVTRVVHHADLQKNTLQFKVAIHDPDGVVKPEMLARVQFVGEADGATGGSEQVFVPEDLLLDRAGDRAVVWIVGSGDKAERRDVVVDAGSRDGWLPVRSGLLPGDRLIAPPHDVLEVGAAVDVVGEAEGGGR